LGKPNPLAAKNVPLSNFLPEELRDALRAHFKLPEFGERATIEGWDTMSSKERAAAKAKVSLPKWAVTAVIADPSNLAKIQRGEVTAQTKGIFRPSKTAMAAQSVEPARSKAVGKKSLRECIDTWALAKAKFSGTSLWKRPRTDKEKAYRKCYDTIKSVSPDGGSFLPQLRERKSPTSSPRAQTPSTPSVPANPMGEMAGLASILGLSQVFGTLGRNLNQSR
jgi:hypothetical protein